MTTEDIVIAKGFTSYTREAERRNNQGSNTSPVTPMTQFVLNRLLLLKAPPPPRDTTLGLSPLISVLWGNSQIQTTEPLEGKDKSSRILLCSEYALNVVFE